MVGLIGQTAQHDFSAANRSSPPKAPKTEAPAPQNVKAVEARPEREEERPELINIRSEELLGNRIEIRTIAISFEMNEELGRVIAKIVDRTTGEVIREIPPKEMQEVAARLHEAAGRLLDALA